jgi:hypothetical protein
MKDLSPLGEDYYLTYVSKMMANASWDIILAFADGRIKFDFSDDGFSLSGNSDVSPEELVILRDWVTNYVKENPIRSDYVLVDCLFIH